MPQIAPFRGLLYDTTRVRPEDVLAPPYDVIDARARASFAARSPHNCVHVILPESGPEHGGPNVDKYARANELLVSWQEQGVLRRSARPAIYCYQQSFQHPGRDEHVIRKGFISAVRLHDFSDGIILPHERTLKGPKLDRLNLWDATGCHLSQVFGMYSDPSRQTDDLLYQVERRDPGLEVKTDDGTVHRVWEVTDAEILGGLKRALAPLKIYIADGHHRYETMLALRQRYLDRHAVTAQSSVHYGAMFLTNMEDSGFVVLPTHRLVHGLSEFDIDTVLAKARQFFDVLPLSAITSDADRLDKAIHDRVAATSQPAFALAIPGRSDGYLLNPKSSLDWGGLGVHTPEVLRQLDVFALHELLFDRVLGISKADQEAKKHIDYFKDTSAVFEQVARGHGQLACLLNATPVQKVCAVADAREVMPQKSTFFFPKLASGIVFAPVDPAVEVT